MATEPARLDLIQLEANFTETFLPLSRNEAVTESLRCLYCYDAPCTHACPTHIDIPGFIKKISSDNVRGAARTILESNFLGGTCARVCPVQELCEGACVLGPEHRPIQIGRLQRYATDHALDRNLDLFRPGAPTGRRVAVVGAGPAGLSCAAELAKLGHEVTVLEKRELAGGLSTYGIVVFREPVEVALAEVEMVRRLGVDVRTGVEVGVNLAPEDLLSGFDAVFLAVGLGRVPRLGVPGEDLVGVYDGLDFIEATKTQPLETIPVGRHVAVVGAGNTAVDAATIARRLGAERVTMVYRRSEAEMTAYPHEVEFARLEGIEYRFLAQPVAVLGELRVEGLECATVRLGEPDASGRPRPELVPGENFVLECDQVIAAIGQDRIPSVAERLGLEIRKGYVFVDPATNRTSHPRVFAGGDCVRITGAASTVMAVQDGKIAARAIHATLVDAAVAAD